MIGREELLPLNSCYPSKNSSLLRVHLTFPHLKFKTFFLWNVTTPGFFACWKNLLNLHRLKLNSHQFHLSSQSRSTDEGGGWGGSWKAHFWAKRLGRFYVPPAAPPPQARPQPWTGKLDEMGSIVKEVLLFGSPWLVASRQEAQTSELGREEGVENEDHRLRTRMEVEHLQVT